MILFFGNSPQSVFAVQTHKDLNSDDLQKLVWLFSERPLTQDNELDSFFIGPRAAMITPWSTNAVEITQNMGISGIDRIEEFTPSQEDGLFDPMISQKYNGLDQEIFKIEIDIEAVRPIEDIQAYNEKEGLALSPEEVEYLEQLSKRIERPLTDSEVFGFSQVNSEHCRHKIFNGTFIIDGEEKPLSLFKLIKKTSAEHPNDIVSAYKDNVAFLKGPQVQQFAPERQDVPDFYKKESFDSVISLKAETHNFPTTVEPFNGAATGSGGEIRDRMAGGKGSIPLAGTALYMTAYSRVADNRPWENAFPARPWLYQTPLDILIKASNGASDFGNKFGQPLINGSLLTFEHEEAEKKIAYDKVIMMAGGIGYGKASQAIKDEPQQGDKIVILGGDNYRIGMGGAAVSSADTGEFNSGIELNAVQRSNPEMQKRVSNAVRSMVEANINPIISIHDHGAGGHLNCLSELVETQGGKIDLDKLPVGDPTLSAKEIIGNESQERMGLVISKEDLPMLKQIAERERAPMYEVGDVTGDMQFTFASDKRNETPMDLSLSDMFGSSPKTIIKDSTQSFKFNKVETSDDKIHEYLNQVLRLEGVACKDWLTNKVDRCVGGRVAKQQCVGPLQLPLNNCGVMAIDYDNKDGIATSMGHAPVVSLIDPSSGARISITEALLNILWAPLKEELKSVSLSANWMWPCKNPGEDARLYAAVEAVSDFAIELGINIPTGKDSLSMKQKYDHMEVLSPGTVVISATGHCSDIYNIVEPVLKNGKGEVYYIDLTQGPYTLGATSLAQVLNRVGESCPDVKDATYLKSVFNTLQKAIKKGQVVAGHDVSSGGLIGCLLEMCFASRNTGAKFDLSELQAEDLTQLLFSENPAIVFQTAHAGLIDELKSQSIEVHRIGSVVESEILDIQWRDKTLSFDINECRDSWYETSYLMDRHQTAGNLSKERFDNYKNQSLQYTFPEGFSGLVPSRDLNGERPKAAILREKGSNSERELAHALYLAGFDVKDVHMSDLMSGRETLEDIQFLGAVGGFSNSDVLGSAKGWAGAILYNDKAKNAIDKFFKRDDVLSIGICNGCQLFVELNLINPEHDLVSKMHFNDSRKHESAFTSVKVAKNNSVMLSSLAGTELGVWISHGEGKFHLPEKESRYDIVAKYSYDGYPSNPNGSDYNAAMIVSPDGRHLVTMPHIERSIFKWNWANYPERDDKISPWIEAFINARDWCMNK